MDSISLHGIRILTRIGITADERAREQLLYADLEIYHPAADIARNDDVSKGIDYAAVTAAVTALGAVERQTLERFAEDAAAVILESFSPAGGVKVTIRKSPADLPLSHAAVTIVRP